MKRFLLIVCLLASVFAVFAQTQQGYVKTRGRLNANGTVVPGTRLTGATITFKGRGSATSGTNGVFTFAVPSRTFCITNVQKKGYQLYDSDLLGRTHNYSTNDLLVVMDTPDNVKDDELAAAKKIRRTLQKQLMEKEDELEALKEQQKITEEQYRKLRQELYAAQENNEKLISDMAKRYSTMDFDQMDDFQRRVAAYIQNGELTRADSMLNTKGSIEERKARIEQNRATLDAGAEELRKRQEEQKKGEALQAREIEDFADDCYSHAKICLLKHKNDSVVYWLEMRANIDSLNVDRQLVTGNFLSNYTADYDVALRYYYRALNVALKREGEKGGNVATIYCNIGNIYSSQGDYSNALEMYHKALKIYLEIFGENHPDVALAYNNIGVVHLSQHNYFKALEMHKKVLKIRLDVLGENHPDVASTYINIGAVCASFPFKSTKLDSTALEMYQKALTIQLENYGESQPFVATIYNNIGTLYDSQGDYSKALEMHQKALNIRLEILGEKHPEVARCYNNIGCVYKSQENYVMALEMLQHALKIWLEVLGENHPDVVTCYNNIGKVYESQGEPSEALELYQKALKIELEVYGENNSYVSMIYRAMADCYYYAVLRGRKPTFNEFTSPRVFTATTIGHNTPAQKAGMKGEYVALEFADWTIVSENDFVDFGLFREYLRSKDEPKTIVVMKDNTISQYHFENTIGVQLGYKCVGEQEKQRILKAYKEWKEKQ